MAGKLNKFQTLSFSHWKGTTKDNFLGAIFQKAPQKASELMVQLLAHTRGKSLESFLQQFPTKTFETDEEYVWQVVGSSRRNIPLVECRDENGDPITGTDNVGAGTTPFYLVFAEDWFADGETIVGNLNELYPVKILGDGRQEGTNTVYKVETTAGNEDGIPAERLQPGERFSIEAAYVEREFSRKVGDIRFASPISMRNEFSTVRIQHKVGGNMLNKKLACGVPVVDNKTGAKRVENYWMHWVDYELEAQFSEYKNNAIMFGRSNRNSNGEYLNIGKSGNVIKQGAGLLEQMEVSNTMYYNDFSLKMIEDALYELSAAKLDFGDRHFVIHTGERGAMLLHKAIRQEVSGWTQFQLNADNLGVVSKTSSPLHPNALKAGYQFTEWIGPMGLHVSIQVDPWYDDQVRNKVMHPQGGVAQSYRFDIFDIGSMEQPNIQKCQVSSQPEYRGYQWGPFRNPFTGATNNPYASFDEDAAVYHKMATLGVLVLDPTRTMSIIPAILQG